MTNSINVPRELLEDLLQNYYWQLDSANLLTSYSGGTGADEKPADCAEELRALLSASSPAGVDGLEVAATYVQEFMRAVPSGLCHITDGDQLCRLSDAQAIIDGLRGEVGAQRVKTCTALKERNDARKEQDEALAECERLRMQLAACGVVALANTIESAGDARQMHPDYMSASCSDVADAVDREIALRTQRDQHAQRIGELEGLLREALEALWIGERDLALFASTDAALAELPK